MFTTSVARIDGGSRDEELVQICKRLHNYSGLAEANGQILQDRSCACAPSRDLRSHVIFVVRRYSSAHRRIKPARAATARKRTGRDDAGPGRAHESKNHKLIKTAPTPGQQKGTPASPPRRTACTSFYGTASRTSGTRPNNNVHFCTSNISGTGLVWYRRPGILFPFAAMVVKARRRPLA